MTTVYVVTGGSYSDFHLVGVFSTREKAESYVGTVESNSEDIREYNLDEEPDRLDVVRVVMTRAGEVCETEFSKVYKDTFPRNYWYPAQHWPQYPAEKLAWHVQTNEIKRAIKVVNEKRTQLITLNRWGYGDLTFLP